MRPCYVLATALLGSAPFVTSATAQPIGTFRWQLQPFCNVVTLAITQNGGVFRLEGTDDQCGGGADQASVTGTAFQNPDGTIGFGLNVVTSPGGRPLHVDAEITVGSFSGTWRDSAGGTGAFVLTPGAGNGGSPRPLPAPAVPTTIQLRPDGGFVAAGGLGQGAIPASGPSVRMMWYPGKAAFRAGQVTGSEWDDANVGPSSVALGSNTVARGPNSVATGDNATASGSASTAMGSSTSAVGVNSVATGSSTQATGSTSTAMGSSSIASGSNSLAAGSSTRAIGSASTALGSSTRAEGPNSLTGGVFSTASGANSLAFGSNVNAIGAGVVALGTDVITNPGSFTFADGANTSSFGAATNGFAVRAIGGVVFSTAATASAGVRLLPSSSQWLSLSDVRAKHRFRDLDGDDVLARIAAMPVTEWSYKAQDDAIRHIGPTAQDFHAAFGLGEDPLRIGTLDADGVALAAVKALDARSRAQAERIDALERQLARALAALCTATTSCR